MILYNNKKKYINKVYLALGSNLNKPINNIKKGINEIRKLKLYIKIIKISSFYETIPYGIKNQPNYINLVMLINTNLNPEKLLTYTQKIEKKYYFHKKYKWGPRILDLDILLFNNLIINKKKLVIPHYDIENRSFFIIPLIEISSSIIFPDGQNIIEKLKKFSAQHINKSLKKLKI